MAELEGSLTTIDWLARLRVGVTNAHGDPSWSNDIETAQRLSDETEANCSDSTTGKASGATGNSSGKPGYSYANLISLAINSSPEKRMTLSDIYAWICENFPYYKHAGGGWKVGLQQYHAPG